MIALIGAVRVLFRFDQRVKPTQGGAVRDVFVALAAAESSEPHMTGGSRFEIRGNLRDTPNVVEHHEIASALHHDAAGFEHPTRPRWPKKFRELVFLDDPKTVPPICHERGL